MARYGFIHDKLDIKFLILYFMARVAAPIDFPTLTELTVCDDGIGYFEFAEAVSELVESGHLTLEDGLYSITEKGRGKRRSPVRAASPTRSSATVAPSW